MLSICITLIRRLTIPINCGAIILSNTRSFCIAKSQKILSICITLIRRFTPPINCHTIILRNTSASVIAFP